MGSEARSWAWLIGFTLVIVALMFLGWRAGQNADPAPAQHEPVADCPAGSPLTGC